MSIPGSLTPLFSTGSSAAAGGYQVQRSLRFNSSDSAYLSRTPAVAGDRTKWTWAGWVKRSGLSTTQRIFSSSNSGNTEGFYCELVSGDALSLYDYSNPTIFWQKTTSQVFRDASAWFHLQVSFDSANGTPGDRVKIYVNGVRVENFSTSSNPSPSYNSYWNAARVHAIGRTGDSNAGYFNGCLAEVFFIDGQALDHTSFTEVSATTGQLIPKAYSGSFGTNGFWLKFSDNSSNTATTLGKDTSGNSNNWTPNNISVTAGAGNDSLVDTPTSIPATDTGVGGEVRGNYCTWNPLNNGGITLSNGNLDWAGNGGGTKVSYGTVAVSSGKWYFEASINGATGGVNWECGIARVGTANNSRPGTTANGWQVGTSGTTIIFKVNNNSYTNIYTSGLSNGDILGVAFDVDNGRIWFARNGTWMEGSPSAGTGASFTNVSGTVAPFGGSDGSGPSSAMNFGQRAFAYTAPSGFKALCDTNLGAPVVAKPSTVFDVITYTGTGSSLTLPNGSSTPTSISFTPDFAWLKGRSGATDHALYDAVRGVQKDLVSNSTAAETTQTTGLTAFGTNTFTVGSLAKLNTSSSTYVAWAWNAGGTTDPSNTAGSITSQVRANVSAGFSIVTWTGNGTAGATVGHGLGVAPGLIIVKQRIAGPGSDLYNWNSYHSSLGATKYIALNTTDAAITAPLFNDTAPTSSVFSLGSSSGTYYNVNNANAVTYVAYCFAPVIGYSNGFSYTGNGSSDGVFTYLGFLPKLILIKRTDTTSNWTILDTSREGYNVDNDPLYPNLSNAEGTTDLLDITSNGFKLRTTDASVNASAGTYIFAAWASNPFQYARAR